jgi:thioredoxin-related protein
MNFINSFLLIGTNNVMNKLLIEIFRNTAVVCNFGRILTLIIALPLIVEARSVQKDVNVSKDSSGIHFVTEISWEDIKAKAKMSNKYILVDCYTTWCGPCKRMDREIFPNANIGELVNSKFISYRAQMDSSTFDQPYIKKRYRDSEKLKNNYNITVFPTYLFFDPNGNLVNKSYGFKTVKQFSDLINSSLNPETQYFTIKEKYYKGELNCSLLNYLSQTASSLRDNLFADSVARRYIKECLVGLSVDKLMTIENVRFMRSFMRKTTDSSFSLFYRNKDLINRIMDADRYSDMVTDGIIYKEEIDLILNSNIKGKKGQPDWDSLYNVIVKKYDSVVTNRIILNGKATWYESIGNNPEYVKYLTEYIKSWNFKNLTKHAIYINNSAFKISEYSVSDKELETAVGWMRELITHEPNDPYYLDTLAALLYKLGRKNEALEYQERAAQNSTEDVFSERLKVMRNEK